MNLSQPYSVELRKAFLHALSSERVRTQRYLAPENLLLSILSEHPDSQAVTLLKRIAPELPKKLKDSIEGELSGFQEIQLISAWIILTPRMQRVLKMAYEGRPKHSPKECITTGDFLIAITQEGENLPGRILSKMNLTEEDLCLVRDKNYIGEEKIPTLRVEELKVLVSNGDGQFCEVQDISSRVEINLIDFSWAEVNQGMRSNSIEIGTCATLTLGGVGGVMCVFNPSNNKHLTHILEVWGQMNLAYSPS